MSTLNLWEHLELQSSFHGEDLAIVGKSNDASASYEQIWEAIQKYSAIIREADYNRILLVSGSNHEAAILVLASMISGVEICPLSSTSKLEEIRRAANLIDPDIIITDAQSNELHGGTLGDIYEAVEIRDLNLNIGNEYFRDVEKTYSYGTLSILTSGSTGEPKMLRLSIDSLWKSAVKFCNVYDLGSINRFWNYLPFSYLGGIFNLLLIPVCCGGSFYLDREFDPQTLLEFDSTVSQFEINTLWLIPAIARGLLRTLTLQNITRISAAQLKAFIGTASSTPSEKSALESMLGCRVYENYGLTETTFIFVDHPNRNVGGMVPFPGISWKEGENGTLLVSTEHLFIGERSPSGISQPESNWFDTQDIVQIDKDGFKVIGRTRDIIKKGGQLVNLAEVEKVTREVFPVFEVSAIRHEDDFYGENYVLFFEAESGQKIPTKVSVITELSRRLSRNKLPSEVAVLESFSRTRSGKVDKSRTFSSWRSQRDSNGNVN